MRIENFRSEENGNLARVVATVVWEDCDHPAQELYFETDAEFAQSLSCNPHPFLVACIMPALHCGEARVFVEAEICPELRDGLMTAMRWIHHWCEWYGPDRKLVQIEANTRSTPIPYTPKRTGCFFSGGIDSLAMLRVNRLNFPLEHPGSIKDGLLIYGFSFGKSENLNQLAAFEDLRTSLLAVAQDAGITLIPVSTNIRQKLGSHALWQHELSGAAFSAVAHAFSQRLNVISIAAGSDIPYVESMAQHPLIEPNCSSYDLRIKYDGLTLSRLAKTKLVADWDVAFQNLGVCNKIQHMQPGMLNCGKCEKCIRTMIALLALGKLEQARTFPKVDISEELLINQVHPKSSYQLACYQELMPLLKDKDRHDLVRGIKYITARYHEVDRQKDWQKKFKKFDREYFQSSLLRLKRLLGSSVLKSVGLPS